MKKYRLLASLGLSAALVFGTMGNAFAAQSVIAPLKLGQVTELGSKSADHSQASQATQAGPGSAGTSDSAPAAGSTTNGPIASKPGNASGTVLGPIAGNSNSSTQIKPAPNTGSTTTNTPVFNTSVAKPTVASQGAVLLDASTGNVLFAKNADTQYYPASITKLMTALLVAENCNLDEVVTFSTTATTNLEAGSTSLGLVAGDQLTVKDCLYALLLKSANEVGNALAEHVAGSNVKFADMMNAKAKALGCTGTHFTNPHGLNDTQHYTTPRDMALIARAAFANSTVKTVASTLNYTLPATKKSAARTLTMGHKMLNPSDSRYYQGIIGGKTGYTSKAGNTLVTVAERNGVRLVAVVMKSSSTHYTDTKALLDYGFAALK